MGFPDKFKKTFNTLTETSTSTSVAGEAVPLQDSEELDVTLRAPSKPLGIETLSSGNSSVVE